MTWSRTWPQLTTDQRVACIEAARAVPYINLACLYIKQQTIICKAFKICKLWR